MWTVYCRSHESIVSAWPDPDDVDDDADHHDSSDFVLCPFQYWDHGSNIAWPRHA